MTIDNASATVPPGIAPGRYVEVHAGAKNASWEWLSYPKTKKYTNAFIVQDGKVIDAFSVHYMAYSDSYCWFAALQILLGYKKRGIGQGL